MAVAYRQKPKIAAVSVLPLFAGALTRVLTG
jgi:hypothetical protein